MRNSFLIFAVALALFLSTFCAAQGNASNKEEAERAWGELIRAKGGRERLHNVRNLLFHLGSENHVRLDVIPGYIWWYTGPFYDISNVRVIDHNKGVIIGVNDKTRTPEVSATIDRDYFLIPRILYLLESNGLKPEILAIRRSADKPVRDVLEVRLGTIRLDLHFEPEEMLVKQVDIHNYLLGRITQKWLLLNYRKIGGIMMPMRVGHAFDLRDISKAKPAYFDMQYAFDVNYNPDIFVAPQKYISPNGWKPLKNLEN